jgi:hypothetical protein
MGNGEVTGNERRDVARNVAMEPKATGMRTRVSQNYWPSPPGTSWPLDLLRDRQ